MDIDHPSAPYRKQRLPAAPVKKGDAGGGFPKLDEMRAWQMPAGAIVSAADATVTYRDGVVVTWGELRRQRRREAA
jgi:hypothetical protein